MSPSLPPPRPGAGLRFSLLFFASGFAGLIYESIWTHYLKLFLGHAAYAQTLVLAIFMGGMALGAAVVGQYSARLRNPMLAYAAVEAAIGLAAISFHPLFTASTDGFYALAQAQGLSGTPFEAGKWGIGVLLILPQSILLGATFPLFAAAAGRADPVSTGRSIATLYFANSIGGALGVLASGFVLIPALDLPGTIVLAGCVNLAVSAIATRFARPLGALPRPAAAAAPALSPTSLFLVAVAFLTGATSFVYEVAWIRMLSLVLGSATHSFEIMLCAFITGLALGGLWVRKRVDTSASAGMLLAYVQLAMGAAAIATLPLYNLSFDLTGWVLGKLPRTDGGYAAFNTLRYGISALVMLPAAFCAGMTLPLATRILFVEERQGERAIGAIYSANTLGAITGLALAVYVGLPVLGLEYLVASGALVDIGLGVALLAVYAGHRQLGMGFAALLASIGATALAATTFDPQKLVSGVFRSGQSRTQGQVLAIAHGRTATISVEKTGARLSIRTNGKPDAAAMVDAGTAYTVDEVTMALLGAIPVALHEAPRKVANIGFGSGMTSATLLMDPRVVALDTIEIEPKMVELARHFGDLNRAAYTDPRSAIHIDDAKSFFASRGQRYDVIVSEPSNPWVSGVAGLFSREFYGHVSRYLQPDGLFVQWLQVYEADPDRVSSVIKALDQHFEDYLVVALNSADVLLVARPRGALALPPDAYSRLPERMRQLLQRMDIASQADLSVRVVGNRAFFRPWIAARSAPANSDYAPYLDAHADRDRFLNRNWGELPGLAFSPYLAVEAFGARPALRPGEAPTPNAHFGEDPPGLAARLVAEALLPAALAQPPLPRRLPPARAQQGEQLLADCRRPPNGDKAYPLAALALNVLPFLSASDGGAVLDAMQELACLQALGPAEAQWPELLRAVAQRDARRAGLAAEALLAAAQGATQPRLRYLLGMAMLGRLADGDRMAAEAVWSRYQGQLGEAPLNLGLKMLRAHAQARH